MILYITTGVLVVQQICLGTYQYAIYISSLTILDSKLLIKMLTLLWTFVSLACMYCCKQALSFFIV